MAKSAQFEWAVVTGASAGIGEAFARHLAAKGTNLVLAARRLDRLDLLLRDLEADVCLVQADLTTDEGRDRLWREVEDLGTSVDLLVNNAGFGLEGEFWRMDRTQQLQMVQTNVIALTDLAHRFIRLRCREGSGALVNVGSVVGFHPVPYMSVYAATKSYVLSFSEALAEEVADSGVKVLALCPGPVPTEFQQVAGTSIEGVEQLVAVTPDKVVEEGLAALARGERVWVPGEVMRLTSQAARFLPTRLVTWLNSRRKGKKLTSEEE